MSSDDTPMTAKADLLTLAVAVAHPSQTHLIENMRFHDTYATIANSIKTHTRRRSHDWMPILNHVPPHKSAQATAVLIQLSLLYQLHTPTQQHEWLMQDADFEPQNNQEDA